MQNNDAIMWSPRPPTSWWVGGEPSLHPLPPLLYECRMSGWARPPPGFLMQRCLRHITGWPNVPRSPQESDGGLCRGWVAVLAQGRATSNGTEQRFPPSRFCLTYSRISTPPGICFSQHSEAQETTYFQNHGKGGLSRGAKWQR